MKAILASTLLPRPRIETDAMSDDTLETIADELVLCRADPVRFVETMFDWQGPELKGKAPEPWQREVLCAIRDCLPLGKAVRLAVASGHGVGKTALVSWIVLWAISTCRDCRGILTASNEAQLHTRNRAELRKWHRLWRGRAFFELTATALISADPAHEQTWRIDLLPWNEHRPESFAGLHNQGKRILVVMDEASVIPPIIYSTLEPAMVDIHTEIIWCVFGNPLHNTGPFRECFGRFAQRWQRWHIDARDVGISDTGKSLPCTFPFAELRADLMRGRSLTGPCVTRSTIGVLPIRLLSSFCNRSTARPNCIRRHFCS